MKTNPKTALVTNAVLRELTRACEKHLSMPTLHHGCSVIQEEYEELREEIKRSKIDTERVYREALQVAASSIRLCVDLIPDSVIGSVDAIERDCEEDYKGH